MSKKNKVRHLSAVNDKWDDEEWWAQYDQQKSGVVPWSSGKAVVSGGKVSGSFERCYHSHPAVVIDGCTIYGGSCSNPVVKDADVYIGFDRSMEMTTRSLPWTDGIEFLYPITDMSAPKNPETFKKLIEWLSEQLRAGKKVHIGCIGGHGRTGLVLAALVKHMTGEEDAIAWVRKHYCKKAVETSEQIKFLGTHFGIKSASATKSFSYSGKSGSTGKSVGFHQPSSIGSGSKTTVFSPVMQKYSLFTA